MIVNKILRLRRSLRKNDANLKTVTTHYGLKYILPDNISDDDLLKLLLSIPDNAYKLPENQSIVLDFQSRKLNYNFISKLLNTFIWQKNINVTAWLTKSPESLKILKIAGFKTDEPEEKPEKLGKKYILNNENNIQVKTVNIRWKIIYSALRSGQKIETDGDVLLWGHLNAGAEIVAGGSIIVVGKLHGIVHAGAYGRNDVFVLAGLFEAPQIRISNKLCYADSQSTLCWGKSAFITIENNNPVIRENKFMKYNI